MKDKIKDQIWFPYTIAACSAVTLYLILAHIGDIWGSISTFVGYFSPIIIGLALAYMINPLARLLQRRTLAFVRSEKLRWTISVILSVAAMILVLAFMLGTLIPQLAESVITLVTNIDSYLDSLQSIIDRLDFSGSIKLNLADYLGSDGSIGSSIISFLKNNSNNILNASASTARGIANWMIALILAVYILMAKSSLKKGTTRLLAALMPQKRFKKVTAFFGRCDRILVQYIVFSLLDALIIGMINALFMRCFGMQYIGLVSMMVAVTNLVPTFGPIIGGVIGGFILLLVKPFHALVFIIFTFVLQFFDGYILKPRLFGNSLGVSGLLILIAVIVFGKMFGVVGILLAIPAAAILYFVYEEELLPVLERRRTRLEKTA